MPKKSGASILSHVPLDHIPNQVVLRMAQIVSPSNLVHTGDDIGPQNYVGTDGIDTFYVDYLQPASLTNTQVAISLAYPPVVGFSYNINGSQLDGSTISGFENLSINVDGGIDRLLVYGDANDNVLSVNIGADFGGPTAYIYIHAASGDDTIIVKRDVDSNPSTVERTDIVGLGGNDTVIIDGVYATIHDVNYDYDNISGTLEY